MDSYLLLLLIFYSNCVYKGVAEVKTKVEEGGVHFEYTNQGGDWKGLCESGTKQSPIRLPFVESPALNSSTTGQLELVNYNSIITCFKLENTNTTHQITPTDGVRREIIVNGGKQYELLQLHFHAPAEHLFNQIRGDLEVHLVHKSKDGAVAVLGLIFQQSDAASAATDFLKNVTRLGFLRPGEIRYGTCQQDYCPRLSDLAPRNASIISYSGSLTTPPCTEGVQWFVVGNLIHADTQDFAFLPGYADARKPNNYRALIEDSTRELSYYTLKNRLQRQGGKPLCETRSSGLFG